MTSPRSLPILLMLLGLAGSLPAQVSTRISGAGLNVAIPGAPFQAEATAHSSQTLADGTQIVRDLRITMGRDGAGRFYLLAHSLQPSGVLLSNVIFDPVARCTYSWGARSRVVLSNRFGPDAHLTFAALPLPANLQWNFAKNKEQIAVENLGTKKIAGVVADGMRTTTTIPVGTVGNNQPIVFHQEIWVSSALQIVLAETEDSPFGGTRTMEVTSLTRSAPPASAFLPPAGLKIRDMTPPFGVPLLPAPILAYRRALQEVKDPDTREPAAEQLLRFAQTHPHDRNHIAHVLAYYKTHLPEATELASESLQRVENETSSISLTGATQVDLAAMDRLAEYWDTWGIVANAKGDFAAAQRYESIAWEVGGEGFYEVDLAHIADAQNQLDRAAHFYQVALSGKMDEREQGVTEHALRRLGLNPSQAVADPTVIAVKVRGLHAGRADFNLLFAAGQSPQVVWAAGDPRLKRAERALERASYPPQLPDDGPEHVLRKGHLACSPQGCRLTLLYAWQADAD
ncbi:MAG TPA: hypothetical protein VME18_12220 [Acidobacteriaceae bacterium]|nr:hypothetical protein [Acidobacteriaceae bacterium]